MYHAVEIAVDVRWFVPLSSLRAPLWYVYINEQGICPLFLFPIWISGGPPNRARRKTYRVAVLLMIADKRGKAYQTRGRTPLH